MSFLFADRKYREIIKRLLASNCLKQTRNAETFSLFASEQVVFKETPLVTVRKTAWKKAIREMEWFISGDTRCPDDLLDWWKGQLNKDNYLFFGYGQQFRKSVSQNIKGKLEYFDQLKYILDGLVHNPNSRRLIMTSWNSGEMANITKMNDNPNTPTSCHSITIQFNVNDGKIDMFSYQRSADILLGVPHNWIQSYAFLLYLAYHSRLLAGKMIWQFGDLHLYNEESHIQIANQINDNMLREVTSKIHLRYIPKEIEYDDNNVPIFKASDFYLEGNIPEPITTLRPKLL